MLKLKSFANKSILAGMAMGLTMLTACTVTGPQSIRVHEVTLYGGSQERIVWVYGQLLSSTTSMDLKLGGKMVKLAAQVSGGLATNGSLSVDNKVVYRTKTSEMKQPLEISRGSKGRFKVKTNNKVKAIYYTDGQNWQKLSGVSGVVKGVSNTGLQGAGVLTDDEARVLSKAFKGQGNMAIAVLNSAPDKKILVEPKPSEHLRSALYLLPNVPNMLTPIAQETTGTVTQTPIKSVQGKPSKGGVVNYTVISKGANANVLEAGYKVATDDRQAAALFSAVSARPQSLGDGTLIAVYMGQRPTGGYSLGVQEVDVDNGVLKLVVTFKEPKPGSMTTQAITSPYTLLRVEGKYKDVQVVDSNGQPLQ